MHLFEPAEHTMLVAQDSLPESPIKGAHPLNGASPERASCGQRLV